MANPRIHQSSFEGTKDGVSPTAASRQHSLTRSPYSTPTLPPLYPQTLPEQEQPSNRPVLGSRSWSCNAGRSKSGTASKPRQQKQPGDGERPKELEIEGPFPSPLPISTLLKQQEKPDQQDPQRSPSVSSPTFVSKSKQEKKVSRSLSDRVKAALNEMFKKPDPDDEGEKISARHWTDEDY